MTIKLRIANRRYPHTEALWEGRVVPEGIELDFQPVDPISRAFAPMVRRRAYDVSEMAIATIIQAKAWGKPIVLLPVTLAARFQYGAFIRRKDGAVRSGADLRGKHVGLRAYSQTTGMWLRGALDDDFGVKPAEIRWTTFEDAHVPEYRDPDFVERAASNDKLEDMLRDGRLDAAIFGADVPNDPALTCLFEDPEALGASFRKRHGYVTINHLLVCDADKAREIAAPLTRAFREAARGTKAASDWPQTRAALEAPVRLAISYCERQGMLPRPMSVDDVWSGLPAGID